HNDISKQRNTGTYLTRYECEELLSISINLINQYANIKLNHKQLHQRPQFIGITEQLDGLENLTVDQVYFWWAQETSAFYRQHDDQYKSIKLFLSEKGYKIIFNLDKPIRVFSFLTG
ncbi:2944_t:CDS:2, partial [Racocetra persica]